MKTSLIFCLSLVLLFFVSTAAPAQDRPAAPTAGYWNVETNRTTRDYTIVRFYDGQDQLVYEERLAAYFDLARPGHRTRRARRQLTAALQRVLRNPTTAAQTAGLALMLGRAHTPKHG